MTHVEFVNAPGFYDPDKPRPCFKCLTEPRMECHVVCSSCHCEEKCHVCHPTQYVEAPVRVGLDPHTHPGGRSW